MLTNLALLLLLTAVVVPCSFAAEQAAAPAPASAGKTVTFETTTGKVKIELFDSKAPVTVANFRKYVKDGYYNGLIFHRVIPGFVIQGGGFEPGMKMRPPTQPSIKNEADNGLKNLRGTLSMARTPDINSATSQFFVNLKDNASLDHQGKDNFGYAVFGKVVEGMDAVDKVAATPTGVTAGHRDVPKTDMVIIKAYEN